MHIAIIGAGALIIFLVIGGLLSAAVLLEQRTRRQMAESAAAAVPVDATAAESPEATTEKPRAMAAASGRA